MAKLTAKQEMFCQEYLKCGDQSKAFREVYNVKETTKPESVYQQACVLMATLKIASRVFQLQGLAQERTLVTVESLTEELNDSHAMAKQEKQAAAMTGATMGKAKLHGLDVQKVDMVGKIVTVIESADANL